MSTWQVAREQWVAFIEDGLGPTARRKAGPLDELDAELRARLERLPFPSGEEETQSRPALAEDGEPFDSMTTMVRPAVDDDDDDDDGATRVRMSPVLDVALRAPEAALEVSLEATPDAEPPEELSPVSGETMVMEAPLPRTPSEPADDDEGGWRRVEQPEEATDDGFFIPALTRTMLSTRSAPARSEQPDAPSDALPPEELTPDELPPEELPDELPPDDLSDELPPDDLSDEPPPDDLSDEPPEELPDELPPDVLPPPPPLLADRTVISPPPPPPDRTAAVSGETVIGPPPSRPPDVEPPASISTTSGIINTGAEETEPGHTLIRGEIPSRDALPEEVVPRKSKVVVDPSASGVHAKIFDDDDVEEAAVEVEPDEIDADDLVEESLEPEPEPVRPPAPSRPPPARELEARVARPALDVGPPPPPLSTASYDAALAALPGAPPLDDGWQVDAFGEHYGALVSPLRPAAAAAEVEFIAHCVGLHPGSRVLDVGCGDGSHCIGLAARGMAVTGLDASPVQLKRASQAAQHSGVAVQLVAGDMRRPAIDGPFDVILCIGSTLGMYTDEDDRIALQHMRDRLAPGGRVVLHVLNRDYLVARLPARSWWQGQGCLILDEAMMFSPTSRVHVHRTVVFETGKQFEHNIGLRLYGLTELVQMCAQVGLRVVEYSGSRHTRGRFYGGTSSEIWVLAQRVD